MRNDFEHIEQTKFFNMLRILKDFYGSPLESLLTFAVPNGSNKSPVERIRFKEEGLIPGVPDVIFPFARIGYSGMALELKIHPNKPSPGQLEYMRLLRSQSWYCEVVWSGEEMWDRFCWYCSRPDWKDLWK
jgi:hypothetical protein